MAAARKRNPQLGFDDPPRGELFGKRVRYIEYDHVEDGPKEMRFHDFGRHVRMFALPDGSILLTHARGERLWEDM